MKILALFLASITLSAQVPTWLAEYDFHEDSGSTVHDISGHGKDGTVTLTNLPGPRWIVGHGLDFGNLNQFVQLGSQTTSVSIPPLHITGAIGIALLYSSTIQEGQSCTAVPWIIGAFDPNNSNNGWGVGSCQAGTGAAEFFNGTNYAVATVNEFSASATATYPQGAAGAPHIRVISVTGGFATFYLDGVADPSGPVAISGSIADNSINWRIGCRATGGECFNGEIAHVAICACALTAGNVASIQSAWAAQLSAVNLILPQPAIVHPFAPLLPWNGQSPTPFMGWMSWYLTKAPNEAIIIPQCQALMARFGTAGYNICEVEEAGWIGTGVNLGALPYNADLSSDLISHQFPLGTKHLVDAIHGTGAKAGIYISAGAVDCDGNVAAYGREQLIANVFSSAGIDYLRDDGCFNTGDNLSVYSPTIGLQWWPGTAPGPGSSGWFQSVYGLEGTAIASAVAATGHPMIFNVLTGGDWPPDGSQCPTGSNAARMQTDTSSWSIIQLNINTMQNSWAQYQHQGCYPDMDVMGLGTQSLITGGFAQLTAAQQRTNLTMWSLFHSPLLLSNDLTTASMTPYTTAQLAISNNSEVITVDQDGLYPQGQRYQSATCGAGKCEVYATKRSGEDTFFIVMFNGDTASQSVTATLANITGASGSYTYCRDVWAHDKPTGTSQTSPGFGSITTSFTATIGTNDVVALRCSNVAPPTPTAAVASLIGTFGPLIRRANAGTMGL